MIGNVKNTLLSKENILSYVGGLIFVVIFIWGYSYIDNNWYEYRDDGVITMSAARNLIDLGFIGVSVSGPIVEVSSSPIQFFTYALAYLFTGVDYVDFSYWQTILATFLIGFLFIRFFSDKPITAITVTTLSAIGLTYFYPFFEWHASGMENAITHVLFIFTLYIFYKSVKENNINFWLAIIVFVATIARIDSVFHIAMLLVIYTVYWMVTYKNLKALYFSLVVFVLWVLFQIWRYYYFGDILPNTAYAQGISMGDRLSLLLHGDINYLKTSLSLSRMIFIKQAGLLIIAIISFAYISNFSKIFIRFEVDKNHKFILILLLSIITTSSLNPFLFGATRIDVARTTTQMTLIVFLYISTMLYSSKLNYSSSIISSKLNLNRAISLLLFILVLFGTKIDYYKYNKAYYLGWSTTGFNSVRNKFISIAKENNIKRPTISNPDLGVMTWYKQFNNIDLGMLGSPIMAKLPNGPMMTEYYLNYGLPDMIESHGSWVSDYCNSIFSKTKFNKLYLQVGSQYDMKQVCSGNKSRPRVFWIRKDIVKNSSSYERKLLNDLQNSFSIERIKKELNTCQSSNSNCSYIARTAYKFIPELRELNKFDRVYILFTEEVDKALLRGWKDGQAHEVIIEAVKNKIK